ncbi:MAG: transposase [Desulfovibrio sp.]|nr:transposase [Desulfovibrio sp.]
MDVKDAVKRHLKKMASDYGFSIDIIEVMPDHVHLLGDCSPH